MGLNLSYILYLQRNGHLTPSKNVLLDIGPQNVYNATREQILTIARNQASPAPPLRAVDRLARRSVPASGVVKTLLSEVAELTGITYRAFDVSIARDTELLDLNVDPTPPGHVGRYDVVLNFGTTEHVVNQLNSFQVIHEAMKVGGVAYCQLPATGYFDHGYFCYTPLFFRDLASANDYEIADMFLTMAGQSNVKDLKIDIRAEASPMQPREIGDEETSLSDFNLHVVFRKTSDKPFGCGLEVATSNSSVHPSIALRYSQQETQLRALVVNLSNRIDLIEHSLSWRITAPLRKFRPWLRHLVDSSARRSGQA